MLTYPNIDPVAFNIGPFFHVGPFPVHWYGMMYLIGFLLGWGLLALRIRYSSNCRFTYAELSDIIFYTALGVIIGGRLGYILFYDFHYFMTHPAAIVQTWNGGMAFHGGLLGVMIALIVFAKKYQKSFFDVTDFMIPAVPIGLGLGRIGNFINGELWGRVTSSSWGMVFPSGGAMARYPSQLYEAFFEGLVLFFILWIVSKKPKRRGFISGLFLILYGVMRFCIEFFREPDPQKGYIAFGWLTEGQLLCIPMVLFGAAILLWAYSQLSVDHIKHQYSV